MNKESNQSIHLERKFIKCYKKDSRALFFAFTLTITLITALLILLHTKDHLERLESYMGGGMAGCSISKLSKNQLDQVIKDKSIDWYGISQETNEFFNRNNQDFCIARCDHTSIIEDCKVIEGRLPQKENEIVAERWAMMGLGVDPKCGTSFTVRNEKTNKNETYTLVGILTDRLVSKRFKSILTFAPMKKDFKGKYGIDFCYKSGIDVKKQDKIFKEQLHLKKDQLKDDLYETNMDARLLKKDIIMMGVLILICMVITYGVYRITLLSRMKEYGILRAVGMKRKQLKEMICKELYWVFLISIPVGFIFGYLIAFTTSIFSKEYKQNIYLNNEKVVIHTVIPYLQIVICILAAAIFVGIVGYLSGRRISKMSVMELITQGGNGKNKRTYLFPIGKNRGQTTTLFLIGGKYILKDIKTSVFDILTISLGITLFTGLAYQKSLTETYRDQTKDTAYLQGQYQSGLLWLDSAKAGISQENLNQVKKLSGVKNVQTSASIPIRVIDEPKVKRNDKYFNHMLDQMKFFLDGGKISGFDGKNQVYTTLLAGYNDNAMNHLKQYVLEGSIPSDRLKDDEIILTSMQTEKGKENIDVPCPGFVKEGTPIMQYHAGDTIKIKYRADFNTTSKDYFKLKDKDKEYKYKTYKVKAIVYFDYMFDCNMKVVYPMLITSDKQIRKIYPDCRIQTLFVDGPKNLDEAGQATFQNKIMKITSKNKNVTTQNLNPEIKNMEMMYQKQMIYIIGFSIIALILVLINMANNLSYRMKTRTREISMMRAIGMSVKMIQRMMIFENMILGVIGVAIAYALSGPACKYLYDQTDLHNYMVIYHFEYGAFAVISILVIVICFLLSTFLSKDWKTGRIMESMNIVE